jgi:nucleoside-diphosphate-sugar epimerase
MSIGEELSPTTYGSLPESINDAEQLEEMLSRPNEGVVDAMARLDGDIIVLGAGGKMGPSLTRMAKRASDAAGVTRRLIAVDRFRMEEKRARLEAEGIETIRCDLLNPDQIAELPDVKNVVFMLGKKFGSTNQEALTWAVNTYAPSLVCRKFGNSRIVTFSSGNVYGLNPISLGGSVETDTLNAAGDYAMSVLGRERIFQYFSETYGIKTSIIRLNYAVEMRYGVLVDIAHKVWSGEPIDVTTGCANVIWQGDANAMALQSFNIAASPAEILNVTGPEQLSIRRVAHQFSALMGKPASFVGAEASDALLNNAQKSFELFGYPKVTIQHMMPWIAKWVMEDGDKLDKPTHFQARDGKF